MTAGRLSRLAAGWLAVALAADGRAETWAGSTATAGLDLPVSALEAVAGGAAAGLVADASAVLVNPARLWSAGPAGIATTFAAWPGGFTDGQVAGALRLPGLGMAGAHLRALQADVPTAPDGDGNFESLGTTPYRVLEGALGYAPDLAGLSSYLPVPIEAGAAVVVKRQDLGGRAQTGFGATVGVVLRLSSAVSVHVTGRDLGASASPAGGPGGAWPMTAAAGASCVTTDVWLEGDRLAVAGSAEHSRETGPGGAAVVEYGLGWNRMGAAVRVGEHLALARAASAMPSAGLALRVAGLALEFGVRLMGDLGTAQVVSLNYSLETSANE